MSDKRLVGGVGPLEAKICIVGEAPGVEEERKGIPFIGSSGQLLTKIIHGIGISREECYITNVVKERPVANNIELFIKFKNGEGIPTKEYIEYEKFLYEELSQVSANVFVAVGAVALWALCRTDKITKRRGSILQGVLGQGGKVIKVIPIIHPASALRNYIFTYFINFDMRRVKEEREFPDIRLPSRSLYIEPTYLDAMAYLADCNCEKIGFDIEVMNEEISCISIARSPYDVMSIPFMTQGHDYFTVEQEESIWREIATILQDSRIKKVGHNISFDATFLFIKYGIRTHNMSDTMIKSGICFPDFPKGLDFVTSICTREPYYKDDGKKWFKYGGNDRDFWLYNAKDSAVCIEADDPLQAEVVKQGNEATVIRQTSIVPSLVYMQDRGIQADKAGMDAEVIKYDNRINELQGELNSLCNYSINPNSTKQLQEYFYIKKGLKPYISRSTGNISVDALALKRLSKRGFKEASIILEMRHLLKIKSTYLEMELDDDNRIRCSFNPVGTENGRLSSSKTIFGKGGNMQNLPPEMLRFLVADPNCLIYNIDLSQAENRIVAYVAPEPNMIAAFEKGIDIHRQTAALLFNKSTEEISDEEGSCSIGGGLFSERFWGKKSNHSLNYDLGYRAFSLLCEIQDNEGRYIVERYHTVYPGVRQYHAWIRNQLNRDRTLTNCMGRKRTFVDRWGDSLFKEAYAFIPQSTVADIIDERGLAYVMDNPFFDGVEILNQVHDSLVLQISLDIPLQHHAECLLALQESLQTPLSYRGRTFSIPAEIQVGVCLDKRKFIIEESGNKSPNPRCLKGVKTYVGQTIEGLARDLYVICESFRASSLI